MEAILLRGHQKTLLFVSGSTKTVEFTDLENYLQSLRDQENPKVGGRPAGASSSIRAGACTAMSEPPQHFTAVYVRPQPQWLRSSA